MWCLAYLSDMPCCLVCLRVVTSVFVACMIGGSGGDSILLLSFLLDYIPFLFDPVHIGTWRQVVDVKKQNHIKITIRGGRGGGGPGGGNHHHLTEICSKNVSGKKTTAT